MSSRGRRGRGRPPKTPLSSRGGRHNAVQKKPNYLVSGSGAHSSRHVPHHSDRGSSEYRRESRGRSGREAAQRSRNLIQRLTESDDDSDGNGNERDPLEEESSNDSEYGQNDGIESGEESVESDVASVYSHSSYSTINSTPGKRKYTRRAKSPTPVWLQDREYSKLEPPKSSEDLLLPKEHIFQTLGIYEVLRRLRHIARLSPFRFEDFCTALISDEQCNLIAEVHMSLLKAILREEDLSNTMFGAHDQKDSINILLFTMDSMTWPAVLHHFLESDPEYKNILEIFRDGEYPYTSLKNKLDVLQFLCDLFLTTSHVRDEITYEGAIQYDDHCRVCHRLGDLLCCETCPAVYHLACVDPPMEEVPAEDWTCAVCKAHKVPGVNDCISDMEKSGLLPRQEPLGYDRHGRKYWFLARRIFVEDEGGGEVYYYSSKAQFEELLEVLDPCDLEGELCSILESMKDEILRQMEITENLTNSFRGNRKSYFELDNAAIARQRVERAQMKAKEEENARRQAEESTHKEDKCVTENESETKLDVDEICKQEPGEPSLDTTSTLANSSQDVDLDSSKGGETGDEEGSTKKDDEAGKGSAKKSEGGGEGGKMGMVTRSKTGSLHPRTFNFEDLKTRTGTLLGKKDGDKDGKETESFLVINKDGEITRVAKSKFLGSVAGNFVYKLGCDGSYKNFVNQYTVNTLALNKPQHAEERDKKRHLSHKFSLTPASEFKWNGSVHGTRALTVATLRQSIVQLENAIATPLLHPNWGLHRTNWLKAVNSCTTSRDFALALVILEACMKPVLFNPVWHDSLGLYSVLFETRASYNLVLLGHYPLGLRHQVWKQKGEEYRITGQGGWKWISWARSHKSQSSFKMGLRGGPQKLVITTKLNEKLKSDSNKVENRAEIDSETKMEVDGDKPEIEKKEESTEVVKREETESSNVKEEATGDTSVANKEPSKQSDKVEDKQELHKDKTEFAKALAHCRQDGERYELVDVSAGLSAPLRLVYRKIARPTKLDCFLERRVQMEELKKLKVEKKVDESESSSSTLVNSTVKSSGGGELNTSTLKVIQTPQPSIRLNSTLLKIKLDDKRIIQKPLSTGPKLLPAIKRLPNGDLNPNSAVEDSFKAKVVLAEMQNVAKLYRCYSPTCAKLLGQSGCDCYSVMCRYSQVIQDKNSKNVSMPNATKLLVTLPQIQICNVTPIEKASLSRLETEKSTNVVAKGDATNILVNHCAVKSIGAAAVLTTVKKEPVSLLNNCINELSTSSENSATTVDEKVSDEDAPIKVDDEPMDVTTSSDNTSLVNTTSKTSDKTVQESEKTEPKLASTSGRIYLAKITKVTNKKKKQTKGILPVCAKYMTVKGKKHSIVILPQHELHKLSRRGGNREVAGFNSNAKPNAYYWPYPCSRPAFKSCWRFRTQTLRSIHAAASQFRIMWASIRWDDMQSKPPPGGTNTTTTETEVVTVELLKRRDVGAFGLRSEFLVRKIIVPIDLPSKPREKPTSQRSGLRERKRPESPQNRGPTVTEGWVPEEELELWEIKLFGDRLEKQQNALREKLAQQQAQQSAQQIKAQMEAQLKLQRQAIQQKRLEQSGKVTSGSPTVTTGTSIIVTAGSTPQTKTITNVGAVVTVGTTAAKTYCGVRRIFTTKGLKPATTTTTASTIVSTTTVTPSGVRLPVSATILPKANQTVIARPLAPGLVASPRPGSIIQVRPAVTPQGTRPGLLQATPTQGTQIRTQIQITQSPNGQLQVRGLLPGQQLVRHSDGRFQLITMPVQQTVVNTTTALSATPTTTVATTTTTPTTAIQITTIRPQVSGTSTIQLIAPQPQTTTAGSQVQVATTGTTQATAMATVSTPQGPRIIQIRPQLGSTPTVALQPQILQAHIRGSTQSAAIQAALASPQIQQRLLAAALQGSTANPSTTSIVVQTSNLNSPAKSPVIVTKTVRPAGQPIVATPTKIVSTVVTAAAVSTETPSTTITTSATTTVALNTAQSVKPNTVPVVVQTSTPLVVTTSSAASPTSTATVAGSPSQKFVLTPQMTQQIIKQALTNPNTTPEIQAKLLALQRHQQQKLKETTVTPTVAPKPVKIVASVPTSTVTVNESSSLVFSSGGVDRNRGKALTPEQKEDSQRYLACQQVLKNILDKIEKEEKLSQKMKKQKEDAEEKRLKAVSNKLQGILLKHKEVLKREILKKRAAQEKDLQHQIQEEIRREFNSNLSRDKSPKSTPRKKRKYSSESDSASASLGSPTPAPRIKKQKVAVQPVGTQLSPTSTSASFNPAQIGDSPNNLVSGPPFGPKEKRLYCLCKTPYDQTRFYIGCDLCSNWFHGECVNITEEKAKHLDEYVCEDCKKSKDNSATEELYCLCRQPYDESQFYICCDRCQDWFHGRCVGILQSEGDTIEEYICPNCQGNNDINNANLKLLNSRDLEDLKKLLKSLQSHKQAWPFRHPVEPKEVPDYYKIIKDPMDLQTMDRKLTNRQYQRLSDFICDMTKIFDNCRYYNSRESPFYRCAESLEAFFVQKIKAFRERLTDV
ncbi:hypothetical protein CHUAL_003435 [Chamberlinius hualienensis]